MFKLMLTAFLKFAPISTKICKYNGNKSCLNEFAETNNFFYSHFDNNCKSNFIFYVIAEWRTFMLQFIFYLIQNHMLQHRNIHTDMYIYMYIYTYIYRVNQEESALLWKMIVWVILSKKDHTNMGSDFERLRSYERLKLEIEWNDYWQWTEENNKPA